MERRALGKSIGEVYILFIFIIMYDGDGRSERGEVGGLESR